MKNKDVDFFGIFKNITAAGGMVYYVKAVYVDGTSSEMETNGPVTSWQRALRHAQAYANAAGLKAPKNMTGEVK